MAGRITFDNGRRWYGPEVGKCRISYYMAMAVWEEVEAALMVAHPGLVAEITNELGPDFSEIKLLQAYLSRTDDDITLGA